MKQEDSENIGSETPTAPQKEAASCYCNYLSAEFRSEHGIPEGYCGICQNCGAPGHTRHHPAPVAYTGEWCDACYRRLQRTWMFTTPVGWLILGIIAVMLVFTAPSLFSLLLNCMQ